MGLSPQHGSHEAAPIASDCGWTEVSLSPCAGHRAPIATSVLGAARYRSVCNLALCCGILCELFLRWTRWANRLGDSSELRQPLPHTSWREAPAAFSLSGCAGECIWNTAIQFSKNWTGKIYPFI